MTSPRAFFWIEPPGTEWPTLCRWTSFPYEPPAMPTWSMAPGLALQPEQRVQTWPSCPSCDGQGHHDRYRCTECGGTGEEADLVDR